MRTCILCDNSHVENIRELAKNTFKEKVLNIGLSENGLEPATHWFCELDLSDIAYRKVESVENIIVEKTNRRDFLKKWNLKVIE